MTGLTTVTPNIDLVKSLSDSKHIMTSYELVVPIKLREFIDNYQPDPAQVNKINEGALERAKDSDELLNKGMAWANVKLSVQVEILKELLASEMARNFSKVRSRGRPSTKPLGIKTRRVKLKKSTTGAPVQHELGGSTKVHAIEAYEQYFEKSGGSAKEAARMYLQKMGVNLNCNEGRLLQDNFRRRINDFHLQSNGKRQRKWSGL
jgi:hypothetical protein